MGVDVWLRSDVVKLFRAAEYALTTSRESEDWQRGYASALIMLAFAFGVEDVLEGTSKFRIIEIEDGR